MRSQISTKMTFKILLTSIAIFGIAAFTPAERNSSKSGLDLAAIDKSVSPANDIYQYANGTWLKNNPVPPEEARWGSFSELILENTKKLNALFDEAAQNKSAEKGTAMQKMRDFYLTAMDTIAIEQRGIKPLLPLFELIEAIENGDDLMSVIGYLQQQGINTGFNFYVHRNLKKSDENICYLGQGGTHLPDRDYYIKDDDRSKKIREEYVQHITRMFKLKGESNPEQLASIVMKMETALAKASKPRVELRDQEKNYNRMSMAELKTLSPSANWNSYLKNIGLENVNDLIVRQPEFVKRFDQMVKEVPLTEWKTYLSWHLLTTEAGLLNSAFVKEDFYFYNNILNGQTEMKPRWRDVVDNADANMGQIIGQVYVQRYFSPESKERVNTMVKNLLAVYRQRIEQLDWMSAATKVKALEKLSKFNTKLGYPDKWKDYTKLEIKRDSYVENVMRCSEFDFNDMTSKLGKPVDKTEWQMQPHTVNAYYDPTLNEIVFPAAIMQPPFFSADADDAMNYGAIGAVIGHEITHGFDDQGSKYDGNGNLNNWWSDEDRKKFDASAKLLIEQFNKYEALPGVIVNGELTLGENIADLGGLNVAYNAYMLSQKDKKQEVIDGLTSEQRFFLAFAQVWKTNYKDEYLRKMVKTDVHSPGMFRAVNAPSNMPSFYKAFNVKDGDKMYRSDNMRAKIW